MEKRKIIACIINCPDNIYQQRVLEGLMDRCEQYGYDLAVFSPLVNAEHFYKDYLYAENNILELPNFELFDGVVTVSLPFIMVDDYAMYNRVAKLLKKSCHCPVVSLDLVMNDYHTVYTNDRTSFVKITRHVVEKHGCRDVYFLSGRKHEGVRNNRLEGFLEGMMQCGLEVKDEQIFHGDFWYTSGQQLAARIISGELHTPQAVICASDHMAIGLANALVSGGIKVPEQVIVTGFDATQEALINECSITTYAPDNYTMAVEAVDYLHSKLEPFEPVLPAYDSKDDDMFIGLSCGCDVDYGHLLKRLSASFYKINRDYSDPDSVKNNEDLCNLNESYMLEALTESKSPEECLGNIDRQVYLIRPLDHFWLCLRPDWLDTEHIRKDGYPRKMRCVIHAVSAELQQRGDVDYFYADDDRMLFDTKMMLPPMFEPHDKPNLYCFMPVHFQQNTLGYAVVQSELSKKMKITGVMRNWMRNVNNALEMARVNNRLVDDSEIDKMTGLKNRRGMDKSLKDMMYNAGENHYCYAIVFDLDGLKYINDSYGHNEGDYAITSVARAVAKVTGAGEIAVRAGGDEFYLIGVSARVTEKTLIDKVSRYRAVMNEINRVSGKPYDIGASVGFCMKKLIVPDIMTDVIREADKHMYVCKAENRKNRR